MCESVRAHACVYVHMRVCVCVFMCLQSSISVYLYCHMSSKVWHGAWC